MAAASEVVTPSRTVDAVVTDTKVIIPKSPSVSMLQHPTWLSSLSHVHPAIKGIFPITEVISPLAGRIQKFLANWKKLLRKMGVCLVIYLDDLLIIAHSKEELKMARDTTMYLFHHLGLTLNPKKSVLDPTQIIEFLGVIVNSLELTFSLPEKKALKLISRCQEAYNRVTMTLRELCSLTGKLRATAPAVSPAPLQIRFLQQGCIQAQAQGLHYETSVRLSPEGKLELKWWIENLRILKGNPMHLPPPELLICSDAAKTGGWGAVCLSLIHI